MGNENDDDDLGIVDVENYRGDGENSYNAQKIIMEQIALCLKNGSVEMVEGWWEEKTDKNGNYTKVYHSDTRRTFIESVKSLMMFAYRDYKDDKKTDDEIGKMIKKLDDRKKFWLEEEWKFWMGLNNQQRMELAKQGKHVSKGMFNQKLQFDNFYFDDELNIYRDIFAIISAFIKDEMKDYGETIYTG